MFNFAYQSLCLIADDDSLR